QASRCPASAGAGVPSAAAPISAAAATVFRMQLTIDLSPFDRSKDTAAKMNRLLRLSGGDPFPYLPDGGDDDGGRERQKKPPGAKPGGSISSLVGELHVRGLLAAATAVVLDLEGDLVTL